MFRFLKSKKGFTIVELMIVLVMLGFGAFALINLSTTAWRSYNKSEERFEKQEAVKNVAEMLQKDTLITAAESAALFGDTRVLPTGDEVDTSYSYLYAIKHTTTNAEGNEIIDGYYLYMLNKGSTIDEAKRISDVPMFIDFEVITAEETVYRMENNVEVTAVEEINQPGVKVRLMALEDDFVDNYVEGKELESDYIYYELDVAYHFPNMAAKGDRATNVMGANRISVAKKIGGETVTFDTVDKNAIVLRVDIDSVLIGDGAGFSGTMNNFCFIATASYGHGSGEVGLLCDFRDSVLMQSAPGRAFVKAYYTVSPPIAKVIAGSEPLKAAVRLVLKPLVIVAEYSLHPDLLAEQMPVIMILFGSCLGLAVVAAVKIGKKRKIR